MLWIQSNGGFIIQGKCQDQTANNKQFDVEFTQFKILTISQTFTVRLFQIKESKDESLKSDKMVENSPNR